MKICQDCGKRFKVSDEELAFDYSPKSFDGTNYRTYIFDHGPLCASCAIERIENDIAEFRSEFSDEFDI